MIRCIYRTLFNFVHPKSCQVWELHHIVPDDYVTDGSPYYIKVSILERKIVDALNAGYQFIPVSRVLSCKGRKNIVVTIDDGYDDNYQYGYPVFKKFDCPFTIFVASDNVFDEEVRGRCKGLTENHLLQLSRAPLCTIGGHTKSHCHLPKLSLEEQRHEIMAGKNALEQFLKKPIEYFAYPYGEYNGDTINIVRQIGFRFGFAAWGGPVRKYWKRYYQIPRLIVSNED